MHILFISDNFPPETNAPANRTYDHTKKWSELGHTITVITCSPNFPDGKVFEGYNNSWLKRELIDGVNIWRVKTFMSSNSGFFFRTLDYLSFMVTSIIFGLFVRKPDLVIGTSPQFFTLLSALFISKVKRVKLVLEIRDLWPASIVAVGAMKPGLFIKMISKIEIYLYHISDLIIVVTESFKKKLVNRNICSKKIKVVFNGVDLKKFTPIKKNTLLLKQFDLVDKFIIGYAGTIGLSHGLSTLISVAKILEIEEKIQIVIVGGGSKFNDLKTDVRENGSKNITVIPRQTKDQMRHVWSIFDISLVMLKDLELFSAVIPSKIFESMAMAIPILASLPSGEATKIINFYRCGKTVAPENPQDISDSIKILKNDDILRQNYSKAGLLAANNYSREEMAKKMLKHIEALFNKQKDQTDI